MRCPQCASRQTIAILLRKLSSAAPCGHRLRCRYQNSGGGYSVASYILSSLREERLGEKGGAFLNGKEGRVGFRKMPFLMVKKVSVPQNWGNRRGCKDH